MATKTEFLDALTQRVRAARERAGFTRPQMAKLLGISEANYVKYESRSALPHYLIERFCIATHMDVGELLSEPQQARRRARQ